MSSDSEEIVEDQEDYSPPPTTGKLPKVGDIIEIPVGIRWEYPKKTGKLTKEEKELALHRKKFFKTGGKRGMIGKTPPTVNIDGEIVDDEQPEINLSFSEDDEEARERHPKVKRKVYRAEGNVGKILIGMAEGVPAKREVRRGVVGEIGVEWVEKDVPIVMNQEEKEFAQMMGMPTKIAKLIPIPAWNPIKNANLTHTHVREVQVGRFGMLYPFRRFTHVKSLETHTGIIVGAGKRRFEIVRLTDGKKKRLRYSSLEGYSIELATEDMVDGDIATVKGKEYEITDARKVPDEYSDIVPGMLMIYYSTPDDAPQKKLIGYYDDIELRKPRKIPTPPKEYKGKLIYGDLVSFMDDETGRRYNGTIVNFKPGNFVIRGNPPHYKEFLVKYASKSIRFIKHRGTLADLKSKRPSELYSKAVPDELRELVRDNLMKMATMLIELSPSSEDTKKKNASINDIPIVPLDKVEWEDYYRDEYLKYHYITWHEFLMGQVDMKELTKQAEEVSKYTRSIGYFLDRIAEYGEGDEIYKGSAGELLKRLNDMSKTPDLFDLELKLNLSKTDTNVLYDTTGVEFAGMLADIILGYLAKYPTNLEQIKNGMINEWIRNEYAQKDPSKDTEIKDSFDRDYLPEITEAYSAYIKDLDLQTKQYAIQMKALRKQSKKIVKTPVSKRQKLAIQIREFEEEIMGLSDGIVFNYLVLVLVPYVFMNQYGGVGEHAKFFQEKVKNGMFKISKLDKANMAHYLPELFMNTKLTDKDIETASKHIYQEILSVTNTMLETYIHMKNPTQQRRTTRKPLVIFDWSKYLVNPIEVCSVDTNSGYEVARDSSGKVIYEVKEEKVYKLNSKGKQILGKNNKPKVSKIIRKKVAKLQPIHLGDLVICYTPKTDKFTCHSQTEILRLISKGSENSTINPYTGVMFPPKFVKRMKRRYSSKLETIGKYESPESDESLEDENIESSELSIAENVVSRREIESLQELKGLLVDYQATVLFIYTDWNSPSKKISKEGGEWDKLQQEYDTEDVRFEKIEYDTFEKMKKEYNIRRLKVPTFLVFSGDELRKKIVSTKKFRKEVGEELVKILE